MGVSDDIGKRYLGIAAPFVATVNLGVLDAAVAKIKKNHLPVDGPMPVLHRKEIMQCRGPFSCLEDEQTRMDFDTELISLVTDVPYRLLAVTIDKTTHGTKEYRSLKHPYHYCLHALMERFCGLLNRLGKTGHVMAEARGKAEDYQLRASYREIYECGTRFLSVQKVQKTLVSPDLEIRKKHENISGLQLADTLAHPANRDVLVAYRRLDCHGSEFTERISQALKLKYNRKFGDGRVNGYGRIFLA